ncbi:MAG: RNA methyltransferase [Deltaproteobacteria bacterium]|nr:RNA methyltransferase [Deltaproteobacteria bacterium]
MDARQPSRRNALREAFERADPAPVIALLEPMVSQSRRERLDQVIGARLASVTVVMDAPHDPHNAAAVMRSCDAFGVHRLHVVERTEPFFPSGAVAKGSERWVDAIRYEQASAAIDALRGDGFALVGTHPEGRIVPADLASFPRVALVMGNEHDGICEELSAACTTFVRIPMRGFAESLNVSVSAAVLLASATGDRAGDLSDLERRRLYARALVLTVPRALDILAAQGIEILGNPGPSPGS